MGEKSSRQHQALGGPRRTQPERRAQTEQRLLEAALGLIACSGSRAMSIEEVARHAGYSRGIVTHQFGGKAELLRRAARHAQLAIGQVEANSTGLGWVLDLVQKYLSFAAREDPATRAFLIMWSEAVAAEPTLRDIYMDSDAWFRGVVASAVQQGIADGSVRAGVDPTAYALALVGQLRGIVMQLILSPSACPPDPMMHECLEMVRRHLCPDARPLTTNVTGLRTDPGPGPNHRVTPLS